MSPFGGSLGFSGSRTSNLRPSTKTILIFVFSSKRSPSVTTRLAIFPFSMEPKRSATPKISAAVSVSARSAASGARPASIDFFAALRTRFGAVLRGPPNVGGFLSVRGRRLGAPHSTQANLITVGEGAIDGVGNPAAESSGSLEGRGNPRGQFHYEIAGAFARQIQHGRLP